MRKVIVLIFVLIMGLSNCSKEAGKKEENIGSIPQRSLKDKKYNGLVDKEDSTEKTSMDRSINEYENQERKRIKTGEVSLEVKDLREAEKNIEEMVNKYNGYISSSNYYQTALYLVIKIPADNYDTFLMNTESIGRLKGKSINVEDVTQYYFDLESKLKNKRILQERYQNYLRKAANTKELLEIESALNNVTGEIEQIEGSFRLLKHQISYSTLNLNLSLPVYENIKRSLPSLKKGFQDLGYNFIRFLYATMFIVLYVVIFGIPVIFLFGVFYFIGFGKVGLIKKFFSLLSSKK